MVTLLLLSILYRLAPHFSSITSSNSTVALCITVRENFSPNLDSLGLSYLFGIIAYYLTPLIIPDSIRLTHRYRLAHLHRYALAVVDGFAVVHFHVRGAVVQHLGVHVLLGVEVDLFIIRGSSKRSSLKPLPR